MKKVVLSLLLTLFGSLQSFAESNLSYSCKVSKWNYHKGKGIDCGEVKLSMNGNHENALKECDLKVYSSSAWGSHCHGLHIILGTNASALSTKNLKESTSIFYCPESAPTNFQMSLLPRSPSVSIDMVCSKTSE